MSGSASATVSFKVGNFDDHNKLAGSHIIGKKKIREAEFEFNVGMSGIEINYGPDSVEQVTGSGQTMPSSIMIPTLVYIGKKTS